MSKSIHIDINDSFAQEPFNFDNATITIVTQIHPVKDGKRQVVLSVNTHNGSPLVTTAELGEVIFPTQITELLDRLSVTMPERQQQAADRKPAPVAVPKPKTAPPKKPVAEATTIAPATTEQAPQVEESAQVSLF
ncbi:MAG: hypothetical protein JST84_04675 [Acidobacteria bacterium]|nr:hypothetical protein [Acidobacteriota bacterium]